jgi:hypothetical protein
MRITVPMPSFEGVAAGQTATCRLPIGRSFHTLLLTYAGVTLAQMDELRIVANGKVIMRYLSGTFLNIINMFYGRATASGVIAIDFDRINMMLKAGEEFTQLGTGSINDKTPITTLNLEIDINAGAAAPALALKAIQDDPTPLGLFRKLRQFTYNAPAAGDYEIKDLPVGDIIGLICFHQAIASITRIKIEKDNYTVFDRTAAENVMIQTDGKRVPQAGYSFVDFSELGYASEGLPTAGVQDLRITLTMSGAMAVPVTVEYLGGINT